MGNNGPDMPGPPGRNTRWRLGDLAPRAVRPPPRTLVDIFTETVEDCPDAAALDNGATVLTYAELASEPADVAERLAP